MTVDHAAQAYAESTYRTFLDGYTNAVRVGRLDMVPEPLREPLLAQMQGRPSRSDVDPAEWMQHLLYYHRKVSGHELPYPDNLRSLPVAPPPQERRKPGLLATLFRKFR